MGVSTRFATIALVTAMLGATGCGGSATDGGGGETGGLGLRIAMSASSYRSAEPIELGITVTNTTSESCRLGRTPEGTLSFTSMTRDDLPVAAVVGQALFTTNFSVALAQDLVAVEPGRSVEMTLRGDRDTDGGPQALVTFTVDGRGGATTSAWPVDVPGRYRLTATYLRPPLPGIPADACLTSTGSASAEFTVEKE
ncbi:hypothetical protein OG225_26235 [Nocardia sp. NBC_01377]|uniref:hypothetical protein n=1 Tax=Nocardia sp. NBC_01377 TaxID=2903595 RepID=UPI0032478387